MRLIKKIPELTANAGAWIACVAIVGMTLLILIEVIARTFFGLSTQFEDEFGGYALVCISFMPLAKSFREGVHIRIDGLVNHLPASLRTVAHAIDRICFLGISALLMWQGINLVLSSFELDAKAQTVTGTPLWIVQLLIPLGMLLLVVSLLADCFAGQKEMQPEIEEVGDGS
jgi:TRAP-type transport system small permease protein